MGNREAMNGPAERKAWRRLEALIARDEPLPEGLYERMLEVPERDAKRRRSIRTRTAAAVAAAAMLLLSLYMAHTRATGRPAERAVRPVVAQVTPPAPVSPATASVETLGSLHRQARSRDVGIARAATVRLGELSRRESLPVLLEALGREACRDLAATALGSLGDERALPALERYLPDPAALAAVVRIGGPEAVETIERRLRLADAEESTSLVAAVAEVGGAAAADALARLFTDPGHGPCAWTALRTHENRLLPHLLARIVSDPDRVLPVLERLAPPSAVDAIQPLLAERAHRAKAARVLARIDTPEAHDALLAQPRAADVREAFRLAGPGMEARLLRDLSHGSRQDALDRIELLGLCGHEPSVAPLESLGADPVLGPRVLTALGRIGGDDAARALGRLASRTALRRPAVEALGWTRSKVAVDVLVDLAHERPDVLGPVLSALARHASPEAVTAIARLDERGTRAQRTLRGMDRDVVIPALLSMLDEADVPVARRALRAFGQEVPGSRPHVARLH